MSRAGGRVGVGLSEVAGPRRRDPAKALKRRTLSRAWSRTCAALEAKASSEVSIKVSNNNERCYDVKRRCASARRRPRAWRGCWRTSRGRRGWPKRANGSYVAGPARTCWRGWPRWRRIRIRPAGANEVACRTSGPARCAGMHQPRRVSGRRRPGASPRAVVQRARAAWTSRQPPATCRTLSRPYAPNRAATPRRTFRRDSKRRRRRCRSSPPT